MSLLQLLRCRRRKTLRAGTRRVNNAIFSLVAQLLHAEEKKPPPQERENHGTPPCSAGKSNPARQELTVGSVESKDSTPLAPPPSPVCTKEQRDYKMASRQRGPSWGDMVWGTYPYEPEPRGEEITLGQLHRSTQQKENMDETVPPAAAAGVPATTSDLVEGKRETAGGSVQKPPYVRARSIPVGALKNERRAVAGVTPSVRPKPDDLRQNLNVPAEVTRNTYTCWEYKRRVEEWVVEVLEHPRPGDPKLERRTGTVLWFNVERGVGFLTDEETAVEYYVNRRSVKRPYLPPAQHNLHAGDFVEYTPMKSLQGPFATGVRVIQRPRRTEEPAEEWEEPVPATVTAAAPVHRNTAREGLSVPGPRPPTSEPEPLIPGLPTPPAFQVGQITASKFIFNPLATYHLMQEAPAAQSVARGRPLAEPLEPEIVSPVTPAGASGPYRVHSQMAATVTRVTTGTLPRPVPQLSLRGRWGKAAAYREAYLRQERPLMSFSSSSSEEDLQAFQ